MEDDQGPEIVEGRVQRVDDCVGGLGDAHLGDSRRVLLRGLPKQNLKARPRPRCNLQRNLQVRRRRRKCRTFQTNRHSLLLRSWVVEDRGRERSEYWSRCWVV